MIPLDKVKDIIIRYDILEKELSSGKIDSKLFAKKSKEYSNLGSIISIAKAYINYESEKKGLEQILEDKSSEAEILQLAEKDLHEIKIKKEKYENELKIFLLPKDEDDDKNAIVEIRAGTGGLEASLFALIYLKCMKKLVRKKNGNLKL